MEESIKTEKNLIRAALSDGLPGKVLLLPGGPKQSS